METNITSILDGYLTLDQTAAELGIHVVTLKKWKARRYGPKPVRVGARWYYSREEWREYIRTNGMPGRTKRDGRAA